MSAQRRGGGAAGLCLSLLLGGCDDGRHAALRADTHVVSSRDDVLVAAAMKRLAQQGPLAVSHIETALHGADQLGRLRLVRALGENGSGDAVDLLRHWALYDTDAEVRGSCEAILSRWAVTSDGRAERARAARAWIQEQRQSGHGPVVKRLP